jgi:hypothetical protein
MPTTTALLFTMVRKVSNEVALSTRVKTWGKGVGSHLLTALRTAEGPVQPD